MREKIAKSQVRLFVEKMDRTDSFSPYDNPCLEFYPVQICQPPVLPLSNLANFTSPPPLLFQSPKSPVDDQTIYVAKILAYLPQLHHQQRQKHPRQLFQSPVPKIITADQARLAQEIAASLSPIANSASSPGAGIPVSPEFFRTNQLRLPLHQGTGAPESNSLISKFNGRGPCGDFEDHTRHRQLVQQCDRKLDALEIKTEPIWDLHNTQLTESIGNFVPLLQAKSPPLQIFDEYDSSESEIYKMPPTNGVTKLASSLPSPQKYIIGGDHLNNNYNNVSPQSFTSSSSEHASSLTGSRDSGIDTLTSHNFSSSPNESDLRSHSLIDEMSEKRHKTMSITSGFLLPPKKRKYTDAVTTIMNEPIAAAANMMQSKLESDQNIQSPEQFSPPSVLPISKNLQTGSGSKALPPRPALIVANPMAKVRSPEATNTSLFSPAGQPLTSEEAERPSATNAAKESSPDSCSSLSEADFSRFSSPHEKVSRRNGSFNGSLHMFGYLSPDDSPMSAFSPLSSASVSPAPGVAMSSKTSFAVSGAAESIAVPLKSSKAIHTKGARSSSKKGPPDSLTCFIRHRSQNIPKEKTFVCEHANCNKAYAKAAHLKSHLRVHTG